MPGAAGGEELPVSSPRVLRAARKNRATRLPPRRASGRCNCEHNRSCELGRAEAKGKESERVYSYQSAGEAPRPPATRSHTLERAGVMYG